MATLIIREVDLRGLQEPLPIHRTHHILHDLQEGDVPMVTTADRRTPADFRTYCEISGNAMLLSVEDDDMYTFLLRRRTPGINGTRRNAGSAQFRQQVDNHAAVKHIEAVFAGNRDTG